MPAISVTDTWDELLTTTLRNIWKTVTDNIFDEMVFLKWLEMKKSVRREVSGGYEIVLPVNYGKNTSARAYSGLDVIETSIPDTATISRWPWKFYSGSIAITEEEMLKNSGEHQRVNLLRHRTQVSVKSVRDELSTDIFTDASADPSKKVTPLTLIVDDGPTSTVGGISGNTNTWWQNHQADVGAFGTNLYNNMVTGINTTGRGGPTDTPDLILFSQTGHEYFERFVTGITGTSGFRVVINDANREKLGFETLSFKGADVLWDGDLASGVPVTGETAILLNSKYFFYYIHPEADMKVGPFVRKDANGQHARVALINHMCELATDNRRKHSILHGIDAS